MKSNDEKKKSVRLYGVDSIRFLMAFSVVMGHLPRFDSLLSGTRYTHFYHAADVLLGLSFNGPAAVIVFFLVSGLCIHFPQRDTLTIPDRRAFYARRLLRISLPMVVSLVLSLFIGERLTLLDSGIYWSLICEIIYYLIYPALLKLRQGLSWQRLIAISFVLALLVILTNPKAGNYPSFTNYFNWIVGLPCWMLGCLLAEQSDTAPAVSNGRLWLLRAMVFAASVASIVLRWHLPHRLTHNLSIGMPWTLDAFSLIAFVWLGAELSWYRNRKPPRFLETAGAWSYSLYLVHPVGFWLASEILRHVAVPALLYVLCNVVVALAAAYIFYRLVEMPSHLLAVSVSRKLKDSR